MQDRTAHRLVRRAAFLANLDEDAGRFSAHSLRAGLCTAAAEAGASHQDVMHQSRHKSLTTLLGYIREATVFKDNPAKGLY